MPVALGKYLFNVLTTIQHPHDLGGAILDPIENNVRVGCERPESRTQLVSGSPGQWVVVAITSPISRAIFSAVFTPATRSW
jgi:hypothetical protein